MSSAVSIDAGLCTGCGTCVVMCPTDVFRMAPDGGKALVAFPGDCHVCFLCVEDCPVGAIALDHSHGHGRSRSAYEGMDPGRLVYQPAGRAAD